MKNKVNSTLPPRLHQQLLNPPSSGAGVHIWLFRMALKLLRYWTPEIVEARLAIAVLGCGREVPSREIHEAVSNAAGNITTRGNARPSNHRVPGLKSSPWPEVNESLSASTIANYPSVLPECNSFMGMFSHLLTAEYCVEALFPGNPLLCVGYSPDRFVTKAREDLRGKLAKMELIVPSPMSALLGRKKSDGKLSAHTLDNCGRRQFLVVEFDKGTPDEQGSLIRFLIEWLPLAMIVSSGNKSLHAWFRCLNYPEPVLKAFFDMAVTLGADRATWSKSQFVRMPGGWRSSKQKVQEVLYITPTNHEQEVEDA